MRVALYADRRETDLAFDLEAEVTVPDPSAFNVLVSLLAMNRYVVPVKICKVNFLKGCDWDDDCVVDLGDAGFANEVQEEAEFFVVFAADDRIYMLSPGGRKVDVVIKAPIMREKDAP